MSSDTDFTVESTGDGHILRVTVTGELDLSTGPQLDAAVDTARQDADVGLVLDLAEVGFIDSSGLRSLLQARDACAARGLRFSLIVTDGPVSRLLDLAGVRDWFTYEPAPPPPGRPAPDQ